MARRRFRIQNAGQAAKSVVYFTVAEVEAAAKRLANSLGKAVTYVEENPRGAKSSFVKNPYAVKINKALGYNVSGSKGMEPYDTYEEAEHVARHLTKKQGIPASVVDLGNGKRRITLDVETSQAPANRRRTGAQTVGSRSERAPKPTPKTRPVSKAVKRAPARMPSKMEALASFFRRNPSPRGYPLPGEYYFLHGGKHYTSRKLSEIQAAAQHMSDQTGRRYKVFLEDYDEKPHKFTTAMRRNPVSYHFIDTHSGMHARLIPEGDHWKFTGNGERYATQPIANIIAHLKKDGYVRNRHRER